MKYKFNNMTEWEIDKAIFLLKIARSLGMEIDGYGELAVNPNSGYTYLWLEDYPFTLYLPIDCELCKSEVIALWTNYENGEEEEYELMEDTTLKELFLFCEEKEREMDKEDVWEETCEEAIKEREMEGKEDGK